MNSPRSLRRKSGFTLIEVLTVVAIIGILAAMVTGAVLKAMETVKRSNASNNCSQIAKSYMMFAATGSKNISEDSANKNGGGVTGWAVYLATKTEFNEAKVWFLDFDDKLDLAKGMPLQVADLSDRTNPKPDQSFVQLKPKSWAVVASASKSAQASSYPIIWTRGLDGTSWNETSPWKGRGGIIGYMDGHTEWYENTKGEEQLGIFIDPKGKRTDRITDAIGVTAKVLEDRQ